jgi:hypothetical protein
LTEDLSNAVYGADVSYGWQTHAGDQSWTLGGEYLFFDGDLSAELDDGNTAAIGDDQLVLFEDHVSGGYAYLDHRWSHADSARLQYSKIQEPQAGRNRLAELDLYYNPQPLGHLVRALRGHVRGQRDGGRLDPPSAPNDGVPGSPRPWP